jgi:hypothetical protein
MFSSTNNQAINLGNESMDLNSSQVIAGGGGGDYQNSTRSRKLYLLII